MKRWLLAAACGIAALGLMLYPLVGELLSEKYHSDIETVYTAAIENTDDTELTAQRQAAEQYNAMLSGQAAITEGGASAPPLAYAEQLTVGGVMPMWTSLKSAYICPCSRVRTRTRWSVP